MIAIIADTITMISDHAKFSPQHDDVGIYRPKIPKASGYYRCVQEHFEQLQMHWQDRYAPRYGFWRSYVTDVIYRYLECGDLHFGFAWVRCQECGHEYRLAYSCKRRHFCPSCRQKRPAMSDVRIWVSAEPRRILSLFGIHPWGPSQWSFGPIFRYF